MSTCLTESEILNANGRIINNSDGTLSVYTLSQQTGQLAPLQLNKTCCEALGIDGAYFDIITQKCRWSPNGLCGNDVPFNLVLNPRGNDGSIFSVTPDEICSLSVDFDYLFKLDCAVLNGVAGGSITGSCNTVIDIFESIGASMTIDVVEPNIYSNLTNVYEEEFFNEIGSGKLYSYLTTQSANTGFFVCGQLSATIPSNTQTTYIIDESGNLIIDENGNFIIEEDGSVFNTLTNTYCQPLDLYNLTSTNTTLNCGLAVNQLLQNLFSESGLDSGDVDTFKSNVVANAFNSNWLHFHTEITDQDVISNIANQKIKLTIKISGSCVDMCVLVDNIQLNKNCTRVVRNDIFVTQSPGYELDRIRDNKKSWVVNTSPEHRTFSLSKADNTQHIRYTDYYLDDARQIINTKEIDLDINLAAAIETDVWNYISNNPCILTGITIGTTSCVKDVMTVVPQIIVYSTITSSTVTVTGNCCPVTAVTSNTVTVTSSTTTFSCPVGYSATPANDACQIIIVSAATFQGAGPTIVRGDTSAADYGLYGTYFYPDITGDGALPLFYSAGNLVDQTGGTITANIINNTDPFWASLGSVSNGRLNNIGISASSTEWLGFSQCISATTGGTYYVGLAADNYCRFYINSKLIVDMENLEQSNFRKWSVFPVKLNSGINLIEMYGENGGSLSAFGAEVYQPISYAALTGATGTGSTQANVIFSTLQRVGTKFDLGTTIGYACPTNFSLNTCATPTPTCTYISNTGITSATTVSYSSSTTTGYCQDMSCVTYTMTSSSVTTTGITTTTATTIANTCIPRVYCCSEFCGDAPVDINSLLTQPLSALTTVEDFEYYLTSELIDVKNRKTISSYPTLRLLYDRYMNSGDFCQSSSGMFDYFTMNKFSNLIGNYWVDLIEQVIPATTIWGSTKIFTNTIFDAQKFKYRSYSTFFGDNSFGGLKPLSPASGISCNASATTMVIQGSSSQTSLFLNDGDEHNYSNVYLMQMNSGSEFLGSVNVIGPSIRPMFRSMAVINECSLGVTISTTPASFNLSNGTATANVVGANGPLTYLWSNGATSKTILGLSAGTYSVTVTDTSINGCYITTSVNLNQGACNLNLVLSGASAYNSLSNGTAGVIPHSGVPPYTYSWNTIPVKTTQSISGLSASTYVVVVTDSVGCQNTGQIIINNTSCNLSLTLSSTSANYLMSNGTATAIPLSGITPYSYTWNSIPVQTTQVATGLSAGTYSVNITDAVGCHISGTSIVSQILPNIYVGGLFGTYSGTATPGIVSLNQTGGMNSSFNVTSNGFNSNVFDMLVQPDNRIVAGGSFTSYQGVIQKFITRLNIDASIDPAFNTGISFNNTISALALQTDGKILAGGLFSTFRGASANHIARMNADGSADAAFSGGFDGAVNDIQIQSNGKILIGGAFSTYNFGGATPARCIIRLNADGTPDSSFNYGSGFNNNVNSISIDNSGNVLVGGIFTTYNGSSVNGLARLLSNGQLDLSFTGGTQFSPASVSALAVDSNNNIYAGGSFTAYNGTLVSRIVRLHNSGIIDTSFAVSAGTGNGFDNTVLSILVQPTGNVLVGGNFSTYQSSISANKIIELTSGGTKNATFVYGTGFNQVVNKIVELN